MDELELLRIELIQVKLKLNNNENYKENIRIYSMIQNNILNWTLENLKDH
jgi:hypothetical protein